MFGASGFLGRRLVADVTALGWDVTAVGRPVSAAALPVDIDQVAFTLGSGQSGLPTLEHHDVAVFLAQSPAYGEGRAAAPGILAVNVVGLAEALEISRAAGVRRFLNASSGSVYPLADHAHDESSPPDAGGVYARSKRLGEVLLEEWSDAFVTLSLRFFALYGPGQSGKMIPGLADRIRRGDAVTLNPRGAEDSDPGGFRTTPCFVGDAAAAVIALAQQDSGGVLNVAGPEALDIRDMAEAIGRVLGRAPKFEVAGPYRAGDLVADVSELRRRTGLPRVRFEQGLAETLGGR